MDKIIHLSRYDHLVGNDGSKVWSKCTAKTAHPLKVNVICPLAVPDMQRCNCPIKHCTWKKMFMAHWQIYNVDQHISCIVSERFIPAKP